jgi:hypothetical protein
MKDLATMEKLQSLSICNAKITDTGLKQLATSP